MNGKQIPISKSGNLEGFALSAAEDKEYKAFFMDDDNQDGYAFMVFNEFKPALPVNDSYTTQEDKTLTVTGSGVLSNDYFGQQAVLKTAPINGVLDNLVVGDIFDGSFSYQPNEGFAGKDVFTYTIDNTHIAEVSIDVTEKPPEITQAGRTNALMCMLLLLLSLHRKNQ